MTTHSLAEERSLALHRAVVGRLRTDPRILERARARVRGWAEKGGAHPEYVEAWREVLSRSPDEIAAFLVDRGEHARALRQVSPFAGALTARERWSIWRAVSPSPALRAVGPPKAGPQFPALRAVGPPKAGPQ